MKFLARYLRLQYALWAFEFETWLNRHRVSQNNRAYLRLVRTTKKLLASQVGS